MANSKTKATITTPRNTDVLGTSGEVVATVDTDIRVSPSLVKQLSCFRGQGAAW